MTVELVPRGAFDLRQSIGFGFGQRDAEPDADAMALGFVLDGYREQVGVAVRQQPSGALTMDITGTDDVAAAQRQAARVLSVDVDAGGWDELGRRDDLIGRLQAARPGLRPPLFYSAYEALCWAVLSARRPHVQMTALRDRFAAAHGAVLQVAGHDQPVLPTPEQLLAVSAFPGLPEVKLRRMHGIARAAFEGELDTSVLRGRPPEEVAAQLRRLDGIGPFYAELVTLRALGHTDLLPTTEPRVLDIAGRLLGRPGPLTPAELGEAAEPWRPWRSWASVALRAAGPALLGD